MLRNTTSLLLSAALISLAATSYAHNGAMGIVKERMDGMSAMGKALKATSEMLKGTRAFDPVAAKDHAELIKSNSGAAMIKLFPEGPVQAVSEARPEIWTDWDRFSDLAMDLEGAAQALMDGSTSEIDQGAFKRVADACAACHKSYRQKK